jgi:TPR repeat protein
MRLPNSVSDTCTNTAPQANLASLYLLGPGVPQNIPEGVRFARMAAAQGVVRAQIALGILYHAVGPGSGRVSSALIMQTWE